MIRRLVFAHGVKNELAVLNLSQYINQNHFDSPIHPTPARKGNKMIPSTIGDRSLEALMRRLGVYEAPAPRIRLSATPCRLMCGLSAGKCFPGIHYHNYPTIRTATF